jgi:hypothetical protein
LPVDELELSARVSSYSVPALGACSKLCQLQLEPVVHAPKRLPSIRKSTVAVLLES